MSPPVPGWFTPPVALPHSVDQHTQKSDPSEVVCPVNSASEIPSSVLISSSVSCPVSVHPIAGAYILSESSSPGGSFPTSGTSCSPVIASQSAFSSAPALFTTAPVIAPQIFAGYVNLDSIGSQILNRNDLAMETPQSIPDLAFIPELNFRSTNPPSSTQLPSFTPVILSVISTPFFNSIFHNGRPVMGSSFRPPIAGITSPIVNAQSLDFPPISLPSQAFSAMIPSESSGTSTGFVFTAPSPAHSDARIGNSVTNSVTRPSQLNRVNPPVNLAVFGLPQGTQSDFNPPISFKDVLAPLSPRSRKKRFEDMLNSMDDLPEPTFLNGIPGIQVPDEVQVVSLIRMLCCLWMLVSCRATQEPRSHVTVSAILKL